MKTKMLLPVQILFVIMLALAPFAGVAGAQGEGTTVASGFNGPMGVFVDAEGNIWVIDSGVGGESELPFNEPQTGEPITAQFGETARIVQVTPDGTQTDIANLPSVVTGMDTLGGARVTLLDGTVYATSGQWLADEDSEAIPNAAAVVKVEDGQVTEVADTWDFEKNQNPDGFILDSHPYGIAAGPDGNLLVADAAANDLLRIDPATGEIEVVTVFEGVPGPFPNPIRGGAMETDPVPTGVTVDQNGNIFVSMLPGFPFLPGSAKVVQVTADGQVSDYATGLTMLTDLRTGPDGNLYAVQFGQFTEQGPVPNSGRIIRIQEGDASEVLVSDLSFPTSIDFNDAGDAYVTINGVGAPGSGELVMFADLVSQAGSPLPDEAPAGGPPAEGAPAEEAPAESAPETLPQSGGAQSGTEWTAGLLLVLGLGLAGAGLIVRRTTRLDKEGR